MAKIERAIETYTDRLGHTIQVGSYVVYGNAIGRASKTAIGCVLQLKQKTDQYNRERVSIRVASIQNDTWVMHKTKPYVKNVWLHEVERVLWYPEHFVPKDLRKLIAAGEKSRQERYT